MIVMIVVVDVSMQGPGCTLLLFLEPGMFTDVPCCRGIFRQDVSHPLSEVPFQAKRWPKMQAHSLM